MIGFPLIIDHFSVAKDECILKLIFQTFPVMIAGSMREKIARNITPLCLINQILVQGTKMVYLTIHTDQTTNPNFCHFSAKGCIIKGFNKNQEDLAISLHQDCSDLKHPLWSYSAHNYGSYFFLIHDSDLNMSNFWKV